MNLLIKKAEQIYIRLAGKRNPVLSRIGFWQFSPCEQKFTISRNWLNKAGFNEDSRVTSDNLLSRVHSDDAEELRNIFRNAIESSCPCEFESEFRIMNSRNEWIWIYLSAHTGRKRKFFSTKISGIILDVNSQKKFQEEIKNQKEELEALYEESEAQNEEMASMMEELHQNHMELEEAAANLTISERKFRKIFENAPFGIVQSTFDGKILDMNPRFIQIFRYDSPDDFKKAVSNTRELYRDPSAREDALKKLQSGEYHSITDKESYDKDGNLIYLNVHYMKSHDSTTGREYLTTFVEDISQLTSSRFERDLFFNNSGDLLAINNFDGTIRQLSASWTSTLGWTEDELLNMKRIEIVHPDDRGKTASFMKELKETESTLSLTNRYMNRNGDYRTIRWTCISFKELELIFAIGRDETERYEAETELKMMWDRLDLAINNGVIGLWDYDVQQDTLTVNKNMSNILGFDSNVISDCEKGWPAYLHEDDVRNSFAAMGRHLKNKTDYYFDQYRLKLPDGTYKWFFSRGKITSRDSEGKPLKMSGSIMDISEQKEAEDRRISLEQKMQQAQKLESLGILAGGIAHDFNNLLTGLLGNADLLLHETDMDSPYYSGLNEIKKTAIRASELTSQMLAYSGKGKFQVKPVCLNELIREMDSLISASIQKKVTISYDLAQNLPAVTGDATQIRQILMNLALNAADSTSGSDGKINITTERVQLTAGEIEDMTVKFDMKPGEYSMLQVSDNGCGIAPDRIKKIFDPFFTTKFTGRGLGLSAVQGILKGHKSGLMLESRPGSGTSFRIFFPASAEKAAAPAEPRAVQNEKNNTELKVLIVDDEEYIRNLAARMLTASGYIPVIAENGMEAVRITGDRSHEISCIILDLTMPNLDGEESLKEIRKIDKDIPVIISSGYCEDEIISKFSHGEVSGFLQKPYQLNELREILQNALNGLKN